jgi:hypothetical protein
MPWAAAKADRVGNGVIEPEPCELSEGGEIREAEVVRQCRIHVLLGDDQALGQPAPQRRGRKVDKLDRAGPHERIWYRLGLAHAGDPGDCRAQGFDIGDIERGIDVDATGQ